MSKINVRSPYHINLSETNLKSALLELYIYTGTQGTRGAIKYSLNSTAYNEEITFEISELVRDYLGVKFTGDYLSQSVWVDYQVTKTVNTVETVLPFELLEGFDGYGYFNEGVNPQLSNKLLQSNTNVYTLDGNYFYIPIQQTLLSKVELIQNGVILYTQLFTPTTSSDDNIRYISYTNPNICTPAKTYIFESGETYIFEDSNVFVFADGDLIDTVLITYSDLTTETITVNTISEKKHTPYKLTFVNKFGVLQDLWFFKRTNKNLNTKKESYKGNILSGGTYSISEHQNKTLTKQGAEKLSLNSGFYPEAHNEIFAQLLLSERVWILYEGQTLPINISSSSLAYKTQLNDKLINYTIDLDFAFDKINSVR